MEIKHLEHENPQKFLLTQNVQRRKPPLNSESETIRGGFLSWNTSDVLDVPDRPGFGVSPALGEYLLARSTFFGSIFGVFLASCDPQKRGFSLEGMHGSAFHLFQIWIDV